MLLCNLVRGLDVEEECNMNKKIASWKFGATIDPRSSNIYSSKHMNVFAKILKVLKNWARQQKLVEHFGLITDVFDKQQLFTSFAKIAMQANVVS